MSELRSACVWRAATCALAAGWVVMACGGGGDDGVAVADTREAVAHGQPATRTATATATTTARRSATEPCRPTAPAPPAARRDTASLEREFVDELRSEMAVGVGTGAGSVDVVDPFDAR